jgi:hypothetical protein
MLKQMTALITLTASDTAKIRATISRGNYESDIAAYFDVTVARLQRVGTGKTFPSLHRRCFANYSSLGLITRQIPK